MSKGISVQATIFLSILSVALLFIGYMVLQPYLTPAEISEREEKTGEAVEKIAEKCDLSAIDVKVNCEDNYGGSVTDGYFVYRKVGATVFNNGTCGGTISANDGDILQVYGGLDTGSTPLTDVAYSVGKSPTIVVRGESTTCTNNKCEVPCAPDPDVYIYLADDDVATDLTWVMFDKSDGNAITESDTIDIDNAQEYTITGYIFGDYEEDYGSGACNANVIVFHANTSCTEDAKFQDENGNNYPVYQGQLSRLLASVTGYTDYAWVVPYGKSNTQWDFQLYWDVDNNNDCSGTTSNATMYYYTGGRYIDNDVSPEAVKCGIMDEDSNAVGASAADSFTIYVTKD